MCKEKQSNATKQNELERKPSFHPPTSDWLFQRGNCLLSLKKKKSFIYLDCASLSCTMWQVGSSSLTRDWTPGSLHREHGVLATGPPGELQSKHFLTHLPDLHPFRDHLYIYKHTAAAAAKSLQSYPTLCDPIEGSPQGSSVHRIL